MLRMLIVDDDFMHCQGIEHLTRQYIPELETTVCDDAQRALELLRAERFDILFVDINMPVLSGLDIVESISAEQPELRVIIYTAHSEFEYTKRAMRLGVKHYILKPIRVEEFCQEVMSAIEECRASNTERMRDLLCKIYYGTGVGEEGADLFPRDMALVDFECSVLTEKNSEQALRQLLGDKAQAVVLNECQLIIVAEDMERIALTEVIKQWTDADFVVVYCGHLQASQLPDAFKRTADLLLSFRFYMESGHVYDLNEPFVGECRTDSCPESLDEVAELVRGGRYEEAEKMLVRFFALIQQGGHCSDLYVKYLVVDFLRKIQLPEEEEVNGLGGYIQQVFSSKNVDALCAWCCETIYRLQQERGDTAGRQVIDRVIEILYAECQEDISLNSLAKRVYLSPSYLSYLFKKNTGESYIKFFIGLRMKKAKELLLQTNLKVGEVGKQVGYANTSYFCMLFRDFYGMSPSQYREAQIK
ncbi:MAG: response regulator [Clostridia bacterium]|nr:response regulator [Clostridia bacterium]